MPVSVPDFTVVAAWHERVHRDPRAGVAATDDRDADCRLGSGEVAGGRGGAAAKGRVMRFVRHGASIALSLLAAGCTTPGPSSPDATRAAAGALPQPHVREPAHRRSRSAELEHVRPLHARGKQQGGGGRGVAQSVTARTREGPTCQRGGERCVRRRLRRQCPTRAGLARSCCPRRGDRLLPARCRERWLRRSARCRPRARSRWRASPGPRPSRPRAPACRCRRRRAAARASVRPP